MNGDRVLRPVVSAWLLAACVVLYAGLRLPWIGHLLTWDEAMNLCSVRAFAAGGQDYYSGWFWHHPPLLNLLMLLVRPLSPGFAERTQAMLVAVGCLNLLALFALVRRTAGIVPALWSAFCLAVMPAAIGYDLWVKQDTLASLLGLIAVLLFLDGRSLWGGLAMGLGLLAKETAAFYAIGIGLLWLAGRRRFRDLLAFGLVALLASAWWYALFGYSPVKYFVAFALDLRSAATDAWMWERPWHYFLGKMPADLGLPGILLLPAGFIEMVRLLRERRGAAALWPAAVALPAYLIISAARGKAAWFTSALYPAVAAVQGLGAWGVLGAAERMALRVADRTTGWRWPAWFSRAMGAALALFCVSAVWGRDYDRWLREQDAGIWWGASASREAAVTLNRLVEPGEKALITPMHYWEYRTEHPCPIFVYYLEDMPVVVRPCELSVDQFVDAVREYDLDWAMVSPPGEGVGEETFIRPLMRRYGLRPLVLKGACIYRTGPEVQRPKSKVQRREAGDR